MGRNNQIKWGLLHKLCIEKAARGYTNQQIAKLAGCSARTVADELKRLEHDPHSGPRVKGPKALADLPTGLTDASLREATQRAANEADDGQQFDAVESQFLFERYLRADILSPEQSMKILSGLSGDPEIAAPVRVNAARLLDDMRQRHQTREQLGPPNPLTPEDRAARLANLIDACGPEIVQKALDLARTRLGGARDPAPNEETPDGQEEAADS